MSLKDCPPTFKIVKLQSLDAERDSINAALQALSRCLGHTQTAVQYQDEGINLGTAGTVGTINFAGSGVVATRVGDVVTITVAGGGGGGGLTDVDEGNGITIDKTVPAVPIISALLSTDVGNSATFGTDAGIYVPASSASSEFGFEVAFDGGGALLTVGALTAGAATMPQAGTIDTVTVTATPGTTATVSVGVYKSTYAAYPTGTLIHTATLTAAQKTQTTGLAIAITAGDQIWGEVLSNTNCVGITVAGTGT